MRTAVEVLRGFGQPHHRRRPEDLDWRWVAGATLVLIGGLAVIALLAIGVSLLVDINGSRCHGEFPFCTSPTQRAAREFFAAICGFGVLAYLLTVGPAFRGVRLAQALVVVVIILAIVGIIVDPLSHLDGGTDTQWFIGHGPI